MNYRIKTPSIIQIEASECGAVSLAIVLQFFNKYVPVEELRVACEVSRDGSNARNIVEAARQYGLEAEGYDLKVSDLTDNEAVPSILFWQNHHFVVFEGHKNGKFYINDPACGHIVLTEQEFTRDFSGVVLIFSLSEKFKSTGVAPHFKNMIKYWMNGNYRTVLFFILTGLLLVFPGIIIPVFTRIFIDDILILQMNHWFPPLIFAMVFVGIMKAGLTFLQDYYLLRFEEKLAIQTSSDIVWKIMKLPIQFFSQRFSGEINSRVGINNDISQFLVRNLAKLFLDIVMVFFFIFIMLLYSVKLTVAVVALITVNAVVYKLFSEKIKNRRLKVINEKGKLYGLTAQGLTNIESIKSMGEESSFVNEYSALHGKVVGEEQHLMMFSNILMFFPSILTGLNAAVVLFAGGFLIMNGDMTVGMLVAYQILLAGLSNPINSLVQMGGQIKEMEGNIKRVEDIMQQPDSDDNVMVRENKEGGDLRSINLLWLSNVVFGYGSKNKPLIADFNLNAKKGECVAIVGKSGSGKSTIANLISGLYSPWKGTVHYNDSGLDNFLQKEISFADQNPILFHGSVRDNLSMLNERLEDSTLVQACKDALIYDVILSKPGKFNCSVNENGSNFSGGERQRLEIARALATNPSLLILDEATNALDPSTEKAVMDNVRKRDLILIVIAHRLSAVKDADRIIVLDQGVVVESGSHEELIEKNGYYAKQISKM